MKERRKEIITTEILYWKTNKMLPPHYCDYLIALYNQGEETSEKIYKTKKQPSLLAKKNLSSLLFSITLLCLSILSLVAFNFTELSVILQTAFLSIFVVFLLIYGFKNKTTNILRHLLIVTAIFIILFQSVHMWESYFSDKLHVLFLLILTQCSAWMLMGLKFKIRYLLAAGVLGLLALIISFYQYFR
ncbi:hypothetical protein [Jeotgalibacillus campisalis]|uniref:DUF2157 domain-containing protein n=1 Tax=Jeotgalibacillus campisalis TaxID=220754 RepID=A0A0C2VPV7_9BACL|nr:hypothetical protein [Jeotgalibacillus campisalis]KIL46023.1 hypothetical protein KR50_26980 [Jeotgalibacillus campisalis]